MKKINVKWLVTRIICVVVMVILVVGVAIGNVIAYDWEVQLDTYLVQDIIDEKANAAAAKAGQKMASQVMTEGAVLLENKNNTLPLSPTDDNKVNVFGYASVDWSYGALGNGTSGMVTPDAGASKLIDFVKAIERYGIKTNKSLQNAYKAWCEPLNGVVQANSLGKDEVMKICEMGMDNYSAALKSEAEQYSETAFVLISRTATEGWDMPSNQPKRGPGQSTDETRTFLQISTEEEELLKYVGANFDKVIVIINCSNIMECGFMNTIPGLDALVHVAQTGTQSVSAVPKLLYGVENFSGKTVDTYAYDVNVTNPASPKQWFTKLSYSNGGAGTDYVEGIYVGYKWYETADHHGVWKDHTSVNAPNKTGYDAVVQYPFGHGESYTTFDWTVKSVKATGDARYPITEGQIAPTTKIEIEVEVKNMGTQIHQAGREVVQAYLTAPYTDGGIEKSYVSLVGYAKTDVIQPQSTQIVTVEIDVEDFMSYDCYDKNSNGFTGWELEKGDYQIKLMSDAHTVKNVKFAGYNTAEEGVITYNVAETITVRNSLYTGKPVNNLFTGENAIDGYALDGIEGTAYNANIPFLSRADFEEGYTLPVRTDAVSNRALSTGAKNVLSYSQARAEAWDRATVDVFGEPTANVKEFAGTISRDADGKPLVKWSSGTNYKVATGSGATLQITELGYQLGADYDDPQWEAVLDQIGISEAYNIITKSPSGNKAIGSVGKPKLLAYDSMVQMKGFTGTPRATGNPSTVVLAQTWNKALVYNFAIGYANEMITLGVQSVFGPGVNIHRSPYSGRNFEYFSEDTYITTECGAIIVRGLQNMGRGVELKHFVLNEKETGRSLCGAWLSEQALREIYLKPFQVAVEQENCSGIMSAYNRIGANWAAGSEALMTGVLRKEWQFKGYVDTDWTMGKDQSPDEQLRAGGDIGMACELNAHFNLDYTTTASQRLQYQMRMAVKHLLYSWLSTQYQAKNYVATSGGEQTTAFIIEGWEWWKVALTAVDITVGFGCALWLAYLFIPKNKKEQAVQETSAGEV